MIDKTFILNGIKKYLSLRTDKELAEYLGIKQNRLSNWRSRNTFDLKLITHKCDFLNETWLLTGEGFMLKKDKDESVMGGIHPSLQEKIELQKKIIELLEKENKRLIEQMEKLKKEEWSSSTSVV
jgi:transcriptional regulator with XRE-family HTH domain